MKHRLTIIVTAALLTLLSAAAVYAVAVGPPEPTDPPGSTSSYTLRDIYQRLVDGTAGSPSSFTEPDEGPSAGTTMRTLNEIMGEAPEVDDTDGATAADVADGKTFWGLTSGEWGKQTGTASGGGTYNAAVPKTGQTTSYATGDDGDLEKGVAWPNPRFTDNSDGTVTDNLTGLIWLKDADCMGARAWSDALTQIGNLNAGTDFTCDGYTAGAQTDWRLPNLRELQSLIDYSQPPAGCAYPCDPALPSDHLFGSSVQSNLYWSSTSYAGSSGYAWYVFLYNGHVDGDVKIYTHYVWPVRGGQ